MKRSNLALAISLAVVFLSGALVGAFSYRLYTTENTVVANDSKRPSPEEWRRHFVDRATSRLKLSADQIVELNAVLDKTKARFEQLDGDVYRPQKRAIREQMVAEITALLNEEQRAEYAKWLEEHSSHRRTESSDQPR